MSVGEEYRRHDALIAFIKGVVILGVVIACAQCQVQETKVASHERVMMQELKDKREIRMLELTDPDKRPQGM